MREDIKLEPFDQAKHEAGFQAIADEVDAKILEQMIEIAKNYKEPGIPKEKAKKIYCKYIDAYGERNLQVSDYKFAKQCALIAVDEIVLELEYHQRHPETKDMMIKIRISQAFQYWKAVKQEIEKL
jgi:hypothetical protein